MDIAYVGIFALFGAVIGSFLNVLCDRLPQGESVVAPPSKCPGCARRLSALDMVPIVSWLVLRGRCRTCGESIPQRVFWVEIITAAAFGALYLNFGLSLTLWVGLLYACITIVIFVIDMEHQLILNGILIPAMVLALGVSLLHSRIDLAPTPLMAVIGGAAGFVIFLLVYIISRGGMGEGDVKLGAFAGLVTGWPNVIAAVILSWVAGGVAAVALLVLRRKGRREAIAFGPFLALTTFITFLWGEQMIDWYLGLFLP